MIIGIIGIGLIGKQRLISVCDSQLVTKVYVLESHQQTIKNISKMNIKGIQKVFFCSNFFEFKTKKIDRYILAGNHEINYEYCKILIPIGKKILLEKPMGRNLTEAKILYGLEKFKNQISVGFNYRFMPGVNKLINEIRNGELGEIVSIKLKLGHGGSPSDKNSWKLDRKVAGGGALLDPGVHLIDFLINSLNFLGPLQFKEINAWRGFWKTGIEESIFALGSLGKTQVFMESSIVSWRTEFSINVLGSNGYSTIQGRGRSDGPQIHSSGKRWAWLDGQLSQIESEVHQTIMEKDFSLNAETLSWINDEDLICNSRQGLQIMKQVSNLYKLMGLH